jgi:hypothetical protein
MKPPLVAWPVVGVLIGLGMATCGCGQRKTSPPKIEDRAALPAPRSLVGAGSCTSSGCHAAPVENHAAWQSAYTVWSTRDPHAGAHEALRGPLAERIVTALVARDPARPQPPAHENMACIGCHATARGPTAGEGVSCESCHGPAGRWLVAHAEKGWMTRGNALGMIDLGDPFICATTCADCHVGGPPTSDGAIREVTHDLVAAGHPRLAFELRSFKRAEPPHWHDRFMAIADGDAPGPLDEWAQGRLAAVANFLRQVGTQARAAGSGDRGIASGVWPEFTSFDCHGCHRPATLVAAMRPSGVRRTAPTGSPRLEPMLWSHLDAILPEESLGPLSQARIAIDRRWTAIPDAATIADAVRAIEAARTGVHARLADASSGDLALQIVRDTAPADWAEAVSAIGGLEALADREAAAGRLVAEGAVRSRLASLRRLLEFPIETVDGRTERFASPRGYDATAVGELLRGIAQAFTGTPPAAPGAR